MNKVLVWQSGLARVVSDKYVRRVDALGLLGQRALLGVAEDELHTDGSLGVRDAKDLFVGATLGLGKRRLAPLEVEGIEREGVDEFARSFVMHVELGVASEGEAVEVVAPSSPTRE